MLAIKIALYRFILRPSPEGVEVIVLGLIPQHFTIKADIMRIADVKINIVQTTNLEAFLNGTWRIQGAVTFMGVLRIATYLITDNGPRHPI